MYNPGFSTVGEILQLWGVGGTIPLGVWGVPVTRVYIYIYVDKMAHRLFGFKKLQGSKWSSRLHPRGQRWHSAIHEVQLTD